MKNRGSWILLAFTLLFVGFTCGFFLGRNGLRGSDVRISAIPNATGAAAISPSKPSDDVTGPVNINTADVAQLSALPGIGQVIAQRIIDYRTEIGGYVAVEELLNVEGIGEHRLLQLKELVTTGG